MYMLIIEYMHVHSIVVRWMGGPATITLTLLDTLSNRYTK